MTSKHSSKARQNSRAAPSFFGLPKYLAAHGFFTLLIVFGVGLLSACGSGSDSDQSTQQMSESPKNQPIGPSTEETLLLQPPPAWLRMTEQVGEAFRLAEFIPAGQNEDDWFDKIFVESNSLTPLPDPIVFLEAMGKELKTECEGSSDANIHSGIENGYETSVRLLVCNKNLATARGEVTLIKAIRGNDNFYVVSRARRSEALQNDQAPLTDKEMGEWSLYMRSVKLCDPRKTGSHPCPGQPN